MVTWLEAYVTVLLPCVTARAAAGVAVAKVIWLPCQVQVGAATVLV